jgi:Flp pilus assembly protein TadG
MRSNCHGVRAISRGDFIRNHTGASAAEFALILPVLLIALFAIIKFGIVLNNDIEITSGARASARVLAISRGSATPYSDSMTAFNNSAPNITGATIALSVDGTACGADGSCSTLLAGAAGRPVSVTASHSCDLNIMGVDFAPGCQLQSQTTERVE